MNDGDDENNEYKTVWQLFHYMDVHMVEEIVSKICISIKLEQNVLQEKKKKKKKKKTT